MLCLERKFDLHGKWWYAD